MRTAVFLLSSLLLILTARAEVTITVEHLFNDQADPGFRYKIDVIDSDAEPIAAAASAAPRIVEAGDGKYEITIDASEAPDLDEWVAKELVPVVREWYPKLVAMLPSEAYSAPEQVRIVMNASMRGVADTRGTRIRCSADWIRKNLQGEAKGAIVHELVHVVQQYGRARRTNPEATRTPGWLVEGIPDYIRWFRFEPNSKGAEITKRNLDQARYDRSYRVTANFLNWVVQEHGEAIIAKLNAAAREGRYEEKLWEELTGKKLADLGAEWKAAQEKRLANGAD